MEEIKDNKPIEQAIAEATEKRKIGRPKKETKPWEKDLHSPDKPWRPGYRYDIPDSFKDPRFSYRFASKSETGRIRQHLINGWEVDNTVLKKMEESYIGKSQMHGTPLGSLIEFGSLILLRIPKEEYKKHRDYYDKKTDNRIKTMEKAKGSGEFEKAGLVNTTYGEIKTGYSVYTGGENVE